MEGALLVGFNGRLLVVTGLSKNRRILELEGAVRSGVDCVVPEILNVNGSVTLEEEPCEELMELIIFHEIRTNEYQSIGIETGLAVERAQQDGLLYAVKYLPPEVREEYLIFPPKYRRKDIDYGTFRQWSDEEAAVRLDIKDRVFRKNVDRLLAKRSDFLVDEKHDGILPRCTFSHEDSRDFISFHVGSRDDEPYFLYSGLRCFRPEAQTKLMDECGIKINKDGWGELGNFQSYQLDTGLRVYDICREDHLSWYPKLKERLESIGLPPMKEEKEVINVRHFESSLGKNRLSLYISGDDRSAPILELYFVSPKPLTPSKRKRMEKLGALSAVAPDQARFHFGLEQIDELSVIVEKLRRGR